CLSTDEWISRTWYIHVLECYSAIKRAGVLMHARTGMSQENVLSERNQTQKTSSVLYDFIYVNCHLCETERGREEVSDCLGLGVGAE
ncbi:hypothetical protein PANDA_005947, partial [Ailuropoda melanoleuca]